MKTLHLEVGRRGIYGVIKVAQKIGPILCLYVAASEHEIKSEQSNINIGKAE